MLTGLLKQLGLTEKQAEIYLAVNRLGPCGVSRIANATNLPRQTVYSVIQDLVGTSFVKQSDKRGVKQFFTEPANLPQLLEEKKRELENNKLLVEKAIPELLAAQRRVVSLPKVEYYENESGLKTLFNGILDLYRRGKVEKEFRGFGINQIQSTTINDFLRDFIKRRFELGVATKLFIGAGVDDFAITDEATRFGREIKRLEMPAQEAGVYLVGERIYLFSYTDNVGVMIENQAMAKLLKATFDTQWKTT